MFQRVLRSISFTQNKPSQEASTERILPAQISGRILDLQMEEQKQTISRENIQELISLYTKAIQFYEETENEKYKLYKKRMHKFLHKPLVQSILKGQCPEMVIKREKNQQILRKAEDDAGKQAKKLIKNQQVKEKQHELKVQHELMKQEKKLNERIRHKRTFSNRQTKVKSSINNEESEKKYNKDIWDIPPLKTKKAAF